MVDLSVYRQQLQPIWGYEIDENERSIGKHRETQCCVLLILGAEQKLITGLKDYPMAMFEIV